MGKLNKKQNRWNLKKFLIIGGICILIGTVSALVLGGRLPSSFKNFLYNAGYSLMIGYGLFANGFVFCLVDKRWLSWIKRPVSSFFIAFLVTTAYSSIVILFTNWFWYGFLMDLSWDEFWPFGKKILLLEYAVLYFITQFFYARAFFFEWQESLLAKEKLKQEAISLQYKVLRNQVNPHFLFNSLNVLSSLIKLDAERAGVFVDKLSGFYRDLLGFRGKEIVSVKEEMQFVNQYINLQKERFGDNIIVETQIDNLDDFQLIPMTLQMLVENAIKHNQVSKENKLKIRLFLQDDYLVVENNLKPYLNPVDGEKLGLKNLGERYKFLTDRNFVVENTDSHFTVKVPLLRMEENVA
ncbi:MULTISPECIES: sensor histidine kinase [unclassified Saccharicrinis]|uniref:sensor histidine kinase n=1 Tax=unclassified Saccharicrinis TaxID=2646859 RepID=UPI003D356066